MLALRSLIYLMFQIATVIPFAFVSIVILPLPLHWRYRVIVCWPRLCIWGARWICGIRYRVYGFDQLPDGPCILLSKHQSSWETLFYPSVMPRELCFVYKRELHHVPFFGWGLASLRMIHIDRSKGTDAFESVVQQGSQRMREGRWIIMFPEGTRVAVGRRGRYKSGGARLAARLGVPVVPIAHNAGERWPRKSFIKRPGTITVSIGPVIPSTGKAGERVSQEVETWIENEMQRISPAVYEATPLHAAAQSSA